MKFGAVPADQLPRIDFSLPPDPPFNSEVLTGKPHPAPLLYLASAVWGHKSWVGNLYPPKTPVKAFREEYPKHFNAAELNATHYNIYPPETIAAWAAPAEGRDFLFCPKFPQSISHYSGFRNADALTDDFLKGITAFGKNLGPLFLQLPENFSLQQSDALFAYLSTLPTDLLYFIEARHPDWFLPGTPFFQRLHALRMGAVITDSPGRRDAVHMHLPIRRLFLRFVCVGTHPSTALRIAAWADRLRSWVSLGLEAAYIMLHPGGDEWVPAVAAMWREALPEWLGNPLVENRQANVLPAQGSLF